MKKGPLQSTIQLQRIINGIVDIIHVEHGMGPVQLFQLQMLNEGLGFFGQSNRNHRQCNSIIIIGMMMIVLPQHITVLLTPLEYIFLTQWSS